MTKTLLVTASARREESVTRDLGEELARQLSDPGSIMRRDVAEGLPFVDEDWVGANFTDPRERTDEQRETLAFSDELVEELEAADSIIIAAPIYNFGVPASLKAWVDMIARARRTFRYSENGPVGLLTGKTAYLVIASGGTAADSEIDFATPYLRHVLGFVGITDVHLIDASSAAQRGAGAKEAAQATIDALSAKRAA